jgi:hypothetical protein
MTPFNAETLRNGTPAISRCGDKWVCHPYSRADRESKTLIGTSSDRMAYFNCDGAYISVAPHKDDLIYMVEV